MSGGGPFVYFLVFLVVMGWSSNYVASKVALREFPPTLLAGMRVILAGVLMLPFYWWERRRSASTWSAPDVLRLLALGVLGAALNQFLFVLGLSRTSVAHSVIFANMSPLIVLGLAAWHGLEKITLRKLSGLSLALSGIVFLAAFDARRGASGASWLGDLLCFGGCVAFSVFTVLAKPLTKRHSAITVTAFAYIGGALVLIPFTTWRAANFSFSAVSPAAWAGLGYMALVSSVLCYLMYYMILSHMPPSRVSAFCYLQPPVATALGVLLLGERVTLSLVFAALVILTGLFLAESGR